MLKRAKLISAACGAATAVLLAGACPAAAAAGTNLTVHSVTLKNDVVSVSVTYSCARGSVDEIWLAVRQFVALPDGDLYSVYGAETINRDNRAKLTCDGKARRLLVRIPPRDGSYVPGELAVVEGEFWTEHPITEDTATKTVRL
jgi:hypothetical protein